MSDNERRYQGLLRKQRLELNYLLKERERLLQAQRKLSDLAGQPPLEEENESEYRTQKKSRASAKQKPFPSLTKAELRKQEKQKQNKAQKPMRQLFPGGEEQFYGSEREFYPLVSETVEQSHFKAPFTFCVSGYLDFVLKINSLATYFYAIGGTKQFSP